MEFPPFKIEEFLSKYEFSAKYMLCGSDMQSLSLSELLELASPSSLKKWEGATLGYTPGVGSLFLREEIATLYPGLNADQILCVSGSESGIFAVCLALLKKEDHVITMTPCYQSLVTIPSLLCSTTQVALDPQHNWQFDLDAIRRAIQPNTKMIIVNFPHNPTGTIISKEAQQELINLATRHDLWLFSDEVFFGMEYEEKDKLTPAASLFPKAISLGVMSKSLGLGGLKVGWVTCQDRLILQKIHQVKQYFALAISAPSEILAYVALQARESILANNHRLIQQNLALITELIKKYPHWFSWVPPKAGCVGFVRLESGMTVDQFAEQLLAKEEVLVMPGRVFGYDQYFRLGFGRANTPEALQRLERFLNRLS